MKKTIKITLIIIGILISIILLDTLQAIIFKTSPVISLRERLQDNDSYIDKGIFINTFYCTKERDIVTVSQHSKQSKFTCPIDKVYELNKNIHLSINKTENCTNQIKEYYTYQDRTIYFVCLDEINVISKNTKMSLKYHLENVYQSFDDSIEEIVKDIENIDYLKDGGTKIYHHPEYTIIVCNTLYGNKDIYFGDNRLKYEEEYCK